MTRTDLTRKARNRIATSLLTFTICLSIGMWSGSWFESLFAPEPLRGVVGWSMQRQESFCGN